MTSRRFAFQEGFFVSSSAPTFGLAFPAVAFMTWPTRKPTMSVFPPCTRQWSRVVGQHLVDIGYLSSAPPSLFNAGPRSWAIKLVGYGEAVARKGFFASAGVLGPHTQEFRRARGQLGDHLARDMEPIQQLLRAAERG